jgi:hypothetical protein
MFPLDSRVICDDHRDGFPSPMGNLWVRGDCRSSESVGHLLEFAEPP